MENGYKTTELEVAAYLKSRGHKVIDARLDGRFVTFTFDEDAAREVTQYFCGALVCAQSLFESHRALRALIKQVKDHNEQTSHKTSSEKNTRHDYINTRR